MLRSINARWPHGNGFVTLSLAATTQILSTAYIDETERGFLVSSADFASAPPFIELIKDYGEKKFVRCTDFAAWAEYEAAALTAEKYEIVRNVLLAAADEIREGDQEIAAMFIRKVSA